MHNQNNHPQQGIVYKKTIENYLVHQNGKTVTCLLSPQLRPQTKKVATFKGKKRLNQKEATGGEVVVVGDRVEFVEQEGQAWITSLLPRQNKLSRRSAVPMPDARPSEQVIVANVDQIVPVLAAANPSPRWNLLDRYLVLAEAHELPAIVCLTKADLVWQENGFLPEELQQEIAIYQKIGYRVVVTSSQTGMGLAELTEVLHDRTSVFLGKSGVGKTFLLNALQPGLGQRVREVSRVSGKGKHTTTGMEMFPLDFGGQLVDTPGIQEFGLWEVGEEELESLFPEMLPWLGQCRFGMSCQHNEEPGCAIRQAVMKGEIHPRRYKSYLQLIEEIRFDEHRLS